MLFGWFRRDPVAALRKAYAKKMKEAKDAEKFGDRALQADLYAEAEAIGQELDALVSQTSS